MVPGHSSQVQKSQPPYEIWPSSAGKRVRLILGSSEGLPYQGFFIVARDIDNGRYVGEFSNLPRLTKHVQCSEGANVSLFFNYFYRFFEKKIILYTFKKKNIFIPWKEKINIFIVFLGKNSDFYRFLKKKTILQIFFFHLEKEREKELQQKYRKIYFS